MGNQSKPKIRVLIVDDSSVVRTLLEKLLNADPEIEVVATAADPFIAREKLIQFRPEVMTLDIEMPKMDGLTFLAKVMEHLPTRTLILSSLSQAGSDNAFRALSLGAVDVVAKPSLDVSKSFLEIGKELTERVKTAAKANISLQDNKSAKISPPGIRPVHKGPPPVSRPTRQILAIASSTGGTEALKRVVPFLPRDIPGTLIVQHMPPIFTKTFAAQLADLCPFEVREAVDGDRVLPGLALIAPGNYHMELSRRGAFYYVKLHQEPQIHGVRPAADYLLNSVAKHAGADALGVVLTGMGRDGAQGLAEMKKAGSWTIAQDEASCVVFGMPKAAIEIGAVCKVTPLVNIANEICKHFFKENRQTG